MEQVREESARPCIEHWSAAAKAAGSFGGSGPGSGVQEGSTSAQGCSWGELALFVYPATLYVDLVLLVLFFTELLARFLRATTACPPP